MGNKSEFNIEVFNNNVNTIVGRINMASAQDDTAKKALFLEVFSGLKQGVALDDVLASIDGVVHDHHFNKEIKLVINLARDYGKAKMFTRISELRWYNIKALVALIRYINKNPKDTSNGGVAEVRAIKNRVSRIGSTFVSEVQYNKDVADLIKAIKGEYKVIITDDTKVLTRNVKSMYNGLTDTQKQELLAMLLADSVKIVDVTEIKRVA